MITPEQINDWIREVEERPGSAPLIIQYISNRLQSLTRRYEELLDENTQLLTGKKVEEYEARISTLEYQLDLLKRQLAGEPGSIPLGEPAAETLSVLVYHPQGLLLRLEKNFSDLSSSTLLGRLESLDPALDDDAPAGIPQVLAARSQEELLLLFDSGRTVTVPVTAISPSPTMRWEDAYLQEPRASEELTAVIPIGRMSLADSCVQASRQGALKRMPRSAFESYVVKNFVGAGVKQNTDRTCGLVLCAKDDRLVLASKQGYLLTADVSRLSYAIEESIRLASTDHVITAFVVGQKKHLIFLTDTGKCVIREASWLEPAGASLRVRGQAVFSDERRRSGAYLTAAVAADEQDWGIALDSSGAITLYSIEQLLGTGRIFPEAANDLRLLSFSVLSMQGGQP